MALCCDHSATLGKLNFTERPHGTLMWGLKDNGGRSIPVFTPKGQCSARYKLLNIFGLTLLEWPVARTSAPFVTLSALQNVSPVARAAGASSVEAGTVDWGSC